MAGFVLRLVTDRLAPGDTRALAADAVRVLFVAEGQLRVAAAGTIASLAAHSAWHGAAPASLAAGAHGARVLRFELAAGAGATAEEGVTLAAPITLDPAAEYLMRCDRVEFPPGGIAYTHTHQGPGLRCLECGAIRIETAGTTHFYAPGEAWFESGPEPVLAVGSAHEVTAFIRVMVLPKAYLGRSSIRYVRPEDQDKPKPQSYQIFIDAPVSLPGVSA